MCLSGDLYARGAWCEPEPRRSARVGPTLSRTPMEHAGEHGSMTTWVTERGARQLANGSAARLDSSIEGWIDI